MTTEEISKIIEKHSGKDGELISILEDIQAKEGYLSEDALKTVADKTRHNMVDVLGVATFYHYFRLKPVGKHIITVCTGTTCHVLGGNRVTEEFQQQLGIKSGETTADKEFSLETVNCLGACALGPIIVVDGEYVSKIRPANAAQVLKKARLGTEKQDVKTDERIFPIQVNCPHCKQSLMDTTFSVDDHPSIRLTASHKQKQGWIRLSSLYGSYNVMSEFEIPKGAITNFFCPHCKAELSGASDCAVCGAPMASISVVECGSIDFCSRRGCKEHLLDLDDVK